MIRDSRKPLAVDKDTVLSLTQDDTFLHNPSQTVTSFDDDLVNTCDELVAACLFYKGVGIAANQVGLPFRICVINHRLDKPFVMVNPHLTKERGKRVVREGCLSVPGQIGLVERSRTVSVRFYTPFGKVKTIRNAEGRLAHVIQHELDHLNGALYTDKLFDPRELDERLREDHDLVLPS